MIDSTAAATIKGLVQKAGRSQAGVHIVGARPPVLRALLAHGVRPPLAPFRARLADAVAAVEGTDVKEARLSLPHEAGGGGRTE